MVTCVVDARLSSPKNSLIVYSSGHMYVPKAFFSVSYIHAVCLKGFVIVLNPFSLD